MLKETNNELLDLNSENKEKYYLKFVLMSIRIAELQDLLKNKSKGCDQLAEEQKKLKLLVTENDYLK